jgi:hypothetical protein
MVPAEILRTPDQRPVNGRSTPVRKPSDQATLNALREHNETLKGEVELLKGQLVTERERGDHAQGELVVARAPADRATAQLVGSRGGWRRSLKLANNLFIIL